MKKIIILALLVVFSTLTVFAASEIVNTYIYLYDTSPREDYEGKLDILRNMQKERLTGAGEFYSRALRDLVANFSNITNATQKATVAEMASILSYLLGQEKYSQAAGDLWQLVIIFGDEQMPLVQAEALQALGKIQAKMYVPQVVRLLSTLNGAPTRDPLTGEQLAFGAILALEKYQDESGYLPVFLASEGWYGNRIKNQAKRSLPFIASDPVPFLMQVVQGQGDSYTSAQKLAALRAADTSEAPAKSKADLAGAALAQAWVNANSNPRDQTTIRKEALAMLRRYRTDDISVVNALARSYDDNNLRPIPDQDEKKAAVAALSFQASEEAAKRLAGFLETLNNRQMQRGQLDQNELDLLRTIIPALGRTRQPAGRAALTMTARGDYTNAIRNSARDALNQIPQ